MGRERGREEWEGGRKTRLEVGGDFLSEGGRNEDERDRERERKRERKREDRGRK